MFSFRDWIKFKWIKEVFSPTYPIIACLPPDYCNGKSDKELIERLSNGNLSLGSGNMIVLELLERLVKKCNQA